jgi:hypothetical protein
VLLSPAGIAAAADPKKGKEVVDTYATVIGAANPAAGAAFKVFGEFLAVTGYFGSAPDPVAKAIALINQRLDALEARMTALEAAVERVRNDGYIRDNRARLRRLQDKSAELKRIARELPTASKERRAALADAARDVADLLRDDDDLWLWSALVLKDHEWIWSDRALTEHDAQSQFAARPGLGTTVTAGLLLEPSFSPMPTLEVYGLALVTWMVAMESAGAGDTGWVKSTYGSDLAKHAAFLSGGTTALPARIRMRIGSWFAPDKYPDSKLCHFHEYLDDAIARERRYVQTLRYSAKADDELCTVPEGFWNRSTTAEEEKEREYGTNLMWLLADKLTRLKDYGTAREQLIGTFAAPGRTAVPAFIYALRPDGRMLWYRHDGAPLGTGTEQVGSWVGGTPISDGWGGFKHVMPGGGNVIHAVTPDGKFLWYRHDGFNTGARREWNGAKEIGSGWESFKHVFSGGNGVVYAITPDGKLMFYRHTGHKEGLRVWEPTKEVGSGWGDFKTVFSGGDGIVYAVTHDGKLLWYKHTGFVQGAKSWLPAKEIKAVGTESWADYKHVFSAGPRLFGGIAHDKVIIYAIDAEGRLFWYGHRGYNIGANFINDRKQVGNGWGDFTKVVALLPDAPDVVR